MQLEPALSYLHQYAGYTEAEIYAHSPKWIEERVVETTDRRHEDIKTQTVALIDASYLGAAAGFGSRDAADAIEDWRNNLTGTKEEEDHMLNPDAGSDIEGLKSAGMYKETVND
jgi:hypothetical protein